MRKNVFGRRFKRDTNERKALFKGLISSFVLNGKIKTTEEKAKAIKGEIDKLVNIAKENGLKTHRLLSVYLSSDALNKLVSDLIPQLNQRRSGYTRIIKLGRRFSDNASLVLMEWSDEIQKTKDREQKFSGSDKLSAPAVTRKISKSDKKPATTETPYYAKATQGKRKKTKTQKRNKK